MDRPKAVVGIIRGELSMLVVFCGQVLASMESTTSGQLTTCQCLSALPGRLRKVECVLDGFEYKPAHLLLLHDKGTETPC